MSQYCSAMQTCTPVEKVDGKISYRHGATDRAKGIMGMAAFSGRVAASASGQASAWSGPRGRLLGLRQGKSRWLSFKMDALWNPISAVSLAALREIRNEYVKW